MEDSVDYASEYASGSRVPSLPSNNKYTKEDVVDFAEWITTKLHEWDVVVDEFYGHDLKSTTELFDLWIKSK